MYEVSVFVLKERLYHGRVLRLDGRLTRSGSCEAVKLDIQQMQTADGLLTGYIAGETNFCTSVRSFGLSPLKSLALAGRLVEVKMIFRIHRAAREKGVHLSRVQQGGG